MKVDANSKDLTSLAPYIKRAKSYL